MSQIQVETPTGSQAKVDTHNTSGSAHADIRALVSATPDATGSVKGKVQLAGDLGGTAAAPTVPGLTGKANTTHSHAESDVTSLVSDLAGKAPALAPTAVKTSAYAASAGDFVPVDTTSGAVTITLPTAPADKAQVGIKHVIQGSTNAVTYACGGSDVINKAGGATSGSLSILAQTVWLQYKASTAIWYVLADDLPLPQLDTRYTTNERVATRTLTNARITKRVGTTASTATLTIDSDSYDQYTLTAQAAALSIANPTGTPTEGQLLLIRIKDNGTARAITWSGSEWRAMGVTLPTTTVVSKTLYAGAARNATDTKWDVFALAQEA